MVKHEGLLDHDDRNGGDGYDGGGDDVGNAGLSCGMFITVQ